MYFGLPPYWFLALFSQTWGSLKWCVFCMLMRWFVAGSLVRLRKGLVARGTKLGIRLNISGPHYNLPGGERVWRSTSSTEAYDLINCAWVIAPSPNQERISIWRASRSPTTWRRLLGVGCPWRGHGGPKPPFPPISPCASLPSGCLWVISFYSEWVVVDLSEFCEL